MTKQITQKEFKRIETKYLLPKEQLPEFLKEVRKHMREDDFARSTISSLYFDTENFQMIQDSLAKKNSREKIRLRSYETASDLDCPAFLEIKQKEQGIGHKYRITTTPRTAIALVSGDCEHSTCDHSISKKLETLRQRYGTIQPQMLIRYQRQAFKGSKDSSIRITIDQNISYSAVRQLTLKSSNEQPLVSPKYVILEIKRSHEMPIWLANLLTAYQLEKTSFSKYGQAYQLHKKNRYRKEVSYAPIALPKFI